MVVALARLANKLSNKCVNKHKLGYEVLSFRRWLCSKEVITTGDDKTVVVDDPGLDKHGNKSSIAPTAERKSSKNIIRDIINRDRDFVPALYVYFPSGLGDAIIQATNNFNSLFKTEPIMKCVRQVKELEDCYKMRYIGIGKNHVKISVKDGILRVKEDKKEGDENEEACGDERWSWSFGCYEKTFVLPKDANVDEIKAEVKDGVLDIVVPRIGIAKEDVKELTSS